MNDDDNFIELNFYLTKDFPIKINLIDSKECIPGNYEYETHNNYHKNFEIVYWTIDYNAERVKSNISFKSDPWLLFHKYNLNIEKFKCENISLKPDKKFITLLFNSSKPHRKKIFDFLISKKIDCYYSKYDDGKELTEIPEYFKNGYYKDNFNYGVPKEYFMSLIDIVTESYVIFSSHFSEKSYKPLVHKKPFITFAGPYYYETLKKYNFELYDELFDYSFDVNESMEERFDDIFLQLLELNKIPMNELCNIILNLNDKIEHNYHNLLSLKSEFYLANEKNDNVKGLSLKESLKMQS